MAFFCYICAVIVEKEKREELQETFATFIGASGRRHTPERVMILDAALRLKPHFDIEQLGAEVEATGEHIARGTVYNTVQLLVDCGILVRHSFGGSMLYELAPVQHSHLVCTECGKVRDLKLPVLEQQGRIVRPARFSVKAVTVTLYGICSTCTRRKNQGNKKQSQTKNK